MKPGIGWIVGAWLVAALTVIIGIGGFVGGVINTVGDAAPSSSFGPGEFVTVRLDPEDKPAIYVSAAAGTKFECGFAEGTPQGRLERPGTSTTVTGSDGITWEQALRIGVDRAGDYQLGCAVTDGGDARFGVGREVAAGSLVGGAVMLVLLPILGFLLAVIVTIVVLVKRKRAKREAAAAAGAWGGPPGG
ncbi:hypothetical protein [Planomonospora venezuelensis]|uniref:Uncharacterized protein n=1 Tax=Planomonospora venezuelensis TaxID=1999 RepID=A0A841D6G4_PLAVE|nr:hypothetical protein [Planomonospora venezuelensis]MBB5964503.1 hypothetical protein [Planomonospora venezuelensis]GIN04238.1 hypothetical protein Pve01_58960 [Planomonospora venezuelensis]